MYDGGDEQQEQQSVSLSKGIIFKRTTASFNERHHYRQDETPQVPIYTRPLSAFSNPLRCLNSNSSLIINLVLQVYSKQLTKSIYTTTKWEKYLFLL